MICETTITVKHYQIKLSCAFDAFTSKLESSLKMLDVEYARNVLADPKRVERYVKSLEGDTGLILFNIQNHGGLLNIIGNPCKAKQYVIGNPLIAIQMTGRDIRGALYAPLRMVVYEDISRDAFVEYDLPSTLFGQFGNDAIFEVAKGLDEKLLNVIAISDGAS